MCSAYSSRARLGSGGTLAPEIEAKRHEDPLSDSAIVEHHFAPYLRAYGVIIEAPAARPDGRGSYIEGRYRYRCTRCPSVLVTPALRGDTWRESWADRYTDAAAYEEAGTSHGFFRGVCFSDAYPGLTCVEDSPLARDWSARFGRPMHEVRIETNCHNLGIASHDVVVRKIAQGRPDYAAPHPIELEAT